MLQPLVLQRLGEDGDLFQGAEQLQGWLGTLKQQRALTIGLLLLHQHLLRTHTEAAGC